MLEYMSSIIAAYTWRDAVEIICFSCAAYYVSLWLKKDTQKNLIGYFYLYSLMFITSYYLQLTALFSALLISAPVVAILFVVMHQRTLQKNFVALRNLTPATTEAATSWLETLMQTCITCIDNQQEVTCIIEMRESLETMLTTSYTLHAPIKKELLDIVVTSGSFDNKKMVWLNAQGYVLGLNASWIAQHGDDISVTHDAYYAWKTEALFFTSATDALIIRALPSSRSFTLVINGTVHEHLRAPVALAQIKAFVNKQVSENKGDFHVQPTRKHHESQSNS